MKNLDPTDLLVRTATGHDGHTWYCAKDVYQQFNITWSGATAKRTPKWQRVLLPVLTEKGLRDAVFINSDAVQHIIKRSYKVNPIIGHTIR